MNKIQFTNENKNQVYNSIRGNKGATFEGDPFHSKATLTIENPDGSKVVAHLGDWIVDTGTSYFVTKDEPTEGEKAPCEDHQ